ncbi:hypothetical protein BGZ61DRAFT_530302 [Ilyonectria robusta]|uniref:uncharacterized protein n=1 Tax=Ilyonectria robusta TaxID=1079257 RepID=UPI001E8D6A41|nr:uncharacterized protein BGZ61DRAFT_530302 [Ilyonectria robusta]KAH8721787.1 hypothetical protein BGZ61DRAFT_530302 [Ilyonectria robusta]
MSFKTVFSGIAALMATAVMANDSIPSSAFEQGGGLAAAVAAAPMYHFGRSWDRAPCYPEAAETDGVQTQGADSDFCFAAQAEGCADPGPWNGANSPGNGFPVYFTVRQCNDNEWRVAYSIYFKKDSGHTHDWENSIVIWNGDGNGQWTRTGTLLGWHSTWDYIQWDAIQNTVNDDDLFLQGGQNLNHAKVYQGFYYHATFSTRKTSLNTCANTREEFRSWDWYFLPGEHWLYDGELIRDGWDWGSADTNPSSLRTEARWICSR